MPTGIDICSVDEIDAHFTMAVKNGTRCLFICASVAFAKCHSAQRERGHDKTGRAKGVMISEAHYIS
jgi:hypothetical protein